MEPQETPQEKGKRRADAPVPAKGGPKRGKDGARRGLVQRSIEWVWGSEPVRRVDENSTPSERALEYERRARVAAELARRALEPPEPFSDGPPDALACGLYHQSIIWALKSLIAAQEATGLDTAEAKKPKAAEQKLEAKGRPDGDDAGADDEDVDEEGPASDDEDEAEPAESEDDRESPTSVAVDEPDSALGLWQKARPEKLLREGNVAPEDIEDSRQKLGQSSFESYAELTSDEQVRWSRKLRVVAEGLIYGIELTSGRYNPPWLARALKLGLIFVLFVGLVWGGFSVREWMAELDNIARGKPWVASSTYPAGCRSPAQSCVESPNFFFHTQEQPQPWLELDLGAVQSVKSVRVRNREDCCSERAIPLFLEVSADGKQWQQLGRKNELFTLWEPAFSPVQVRWLRLRVGKKSILHLAGVDVYR